MARNPYQMDPFLAQGFSNLTKALIGDPQTDYQVAQTNRLAKLTPLQAALLEQQAATEKQQGLSYAADARKTGLEGDQLANTIAALKTLSQNQDIAQAVGAGLGLPLDENTQLPIPIPADAASALAYRLFAEGNADDIANAIDTAGAARAKRFAERSILTGDDDAIFRGSRLLSPAGTSKYQDPRFAGQELQSEFDLGVKVSEDDLAGDRYAANQKRKADEYETDARFGEGGQEDRSDKLKADTDIKIEKLSNQSDLDIEKLKLGQAVLKPGEVLVREDKNGKFVEVAKAGETINKAVKPGETLYILDGKGEMLAEVTAPITKGSKSTNNSIDFGRFNSQFSGAIKDFAPDLSNLPPQALAKIKQIARQNIVSDSDEGIDYAQSFDDSVMPILTAGVVTLGTGMVDGAYKFTFPRYFLEFPPLKNNPDELKKFAKEMGYDEAEIALILEAASQ